MFRVDVKKMAAPKTLGDQSTVLLDRMTMANNLQLNIRRQRKGSCKSMMNMKRNSFREIDIYYNLLCFQESPGLL